MEVTRSLVCSIVFGAIALVEAFIIALGVDVMIDLRDTAQYYHQESDLKDFYLEECRGLIYEKEYQEYQKMEEANQ